MYFENGFKDKTASKQKSTALAIVLPADKKSRTVRWTACRLHGDGRGLPLSLGDWSLQLAPLRCGTPRPHAVWDVLMLHRTMRFKKKKKLLYCRARMELCRINWHSAYILLQSEMHECNIYWNYAVSMKRANCFVSLQKQLKMFKIEDFVTTKIGCMTQYQNRR